MSLCHIIDRYYKPIQQHSSITPNFNEMPQSAAELLLFPVLKTDVRHIGILLRVFTLTFSSLGVVHKGRPQKFGDF